MLSLNMKKKMLEAQIASDIQDRIAEFKASNGVSVISMSIKFKETYVRHDRFILDSVEVELKG